MEMYVDVTRASNSAPMIVKIWVEEEDGPGEQAMLIRGHFTVTQGVSATYPYGVMEAHFRGTTLDGDIEMFHMAMSVGAENGNVIIETVEDSEEGGDYGFHSKVQVIANSDVTQGNAYVWESDTRPDWENPGETYTETSTELIAFNENYFKVTENNIDSFYSKDNLMHRIYNYKLFNYDDGSKLDMNSGFPIETADGKHGYIGYWGIWAPYGASIDNGDTVTDMDGVDYTVFRSRGKLTKHTQASIALGELNGMELSKWECGETECTDVIVTWNGDDNKFIKLGTRNQNNGMIEYLAEGDDGFHAEVTFSQWDGAWCESLRAYLRLGNLVTPTDMSTVYYHSEQTLDPQTATDLTLYTWEFTMDMPIDQDAVNNFNTDRDTYWGGTPSEKTFYFNAANMLLEDVDSNPATIGSDLTIPDDSDLRWGYHIGPLTTDHYTIDNFWQAHEAETYYTWNSGNDDWNQFATLKDGNDEFVSFDAPISFSYIHSQANDINDYPEYDGKVFRMEYDGNSVFIPWEFDETTEEWEPQINIKDGVRMGDSNQYVIKGTEESLIMAEIADPGATFPENSVGEPDLEYDSTKTAQVGAIPEDAELKVIKGELIP